MSVVYDWSEYTSLTFSKFLIATLVAGIFMHMFSEKLPVVNMVLTGGTNSSEFSDCEKSDADITGDGTINILDVIQIINIVLGVDLERTDLKAFGYVDTKYDIKGDDLHLSFTSKVPFSGLELAFLSDYDLNIIKKDNHNFSLVKNLKNGIEYCVVYSLNNESFTNNTLNIVIKDGALLNIEDMKITAGNARGQEVPSRWIAAEVNNFNIDKVYPNPFNPVTQIDYKVDQAGDLRLSIYNILGQEVAVLSNGTHLEGTYTVNWDASSFSSGVYYVRMMLDGQMGKPVKAVLIK